jgi:hypothetical protein
VHALEIAIVCHEANRAWCESNGDNSQQHWEMAPLWQQKSALIGVEKILSGEVNTPEDSHKSWLAQKEKDGWCFGPVKDVAKKQHPCFIEYGALPEAQRKKDHIFFSIVNALKESA